MNKILSHAVAPRKSISSESYLLSKSIIHLKIIQKNNAINGTLNKSSKNVKNFGFISPAIRQLNFKIHFVFLFSFVRTIGHWS